jgi:hypothetical protein
MQICIRLLSIFFIFFFCRCWCEAGVCVQAPDNRIGGHTVFPGLLAVWLLVQPQHKAIKNTNGVKLPLAVTKEFRKKYLLQCFVAGFRHYKGVKQLNEIKKGDLI